MSAPKNTVRVLYRVMLGLLFIAQLSSTTLAAVNASADMVTGCAQVTSSVAVSNQANPAEVLRHGRAAELSYSFSGADGNSGSERGAQSQSGRVVVDIALATATSPGVELASMALAMMFDEAVSIDNFIAPTTQQVGWIAADSFCRGLGNGARLPTARELKSLFVDATSATIADGSQINSEMCTVYGWPLFYQCGGGGIGAYYWTSESADAASHEVIGLVGGDSNIGNNSLALSVACLR